MWLKDRYKLDRHYAIDAIPKAIDILLAAISTQEIDE